MLGKVKLNAKLLLMMIIPIVGLCVFASWQIVDNLILKKNADHILSVTRALITTNNFLSELQTERSMAALVISSRGKKFTAEFKQQLFVTDSALDKFTNMLAENPSILLEGMENQSTPLMQKVTELREKIQQRKIRSMRYLKSYDELASWLLKINNILPKTATNSPLGVLGATYISFLHAKELAAIESALLANVFQKDAFPAGSFKQFTTLMTSQKTYLSMFRSLASPEQQAYFEKTFQGEAIVETNRMRESAFAASDYGAFGIDPAYWLEMQSKKLSLMENIESYLSDELTKRAQAISENAGNNTYNSIAITVVVLLITIVSMVFIQKSILSPIKIMMKSVSELSTGEGDLTIQLKVKGEDEIAELGRGINAFISSVGNIASQVSKTACQLGDVAGNVQNNSQLVIKGMQLQKNYTEQAATSMENMRLDSSNIVAITKEAVEYASSMDEKANSGNRELEKMLGMIQQLAEAIGDASSSMHKQIEHSDSIGGVLESIRGIAEQTNLLALNAAIEAARAGEQGRGFAVVADEVRALSEKTQNATSEIQTMMESFQSDTLSVASVISNKKEIAQQSVQQANSAIDSFKSIMSGIHEIEKTSTQIADSAKQQNAICDRVANNLCSIDTESASNVEKADSSVSLSTNLNDLAQELRRLIERFKLA